MNTMSNHTPNRFTDPAAIKALRESLGETRRAFGQRLYDLPDDAAYHAVYKLETGRRDANAVTRRFLERIANDL